MATKEDIKRDGRYWDFIKDCPIKEVPPTQNGWIAFVQSVKELYPDTVLSKKDYSNMMDWYVTGRSAEKYVKENME